MEAELKATLDAESGVAFEVAWSPSGGRLAAAGLEGAVRIWDEPLGPDATAMDIGFESLVSCIAWSPSGHHLVGGASSGALALFDVSTGTHRDVVAHGDEVRSVAYSPDGARIASGGNDAGVRVWSADELSLIGELAGHAALVRSVAWSPSGNTLASTGHDGSVQVWDATSMSNLGALADHRGFVSKVIYSPDGRLIASAGNDSTVRIWDLQSATYTCVLDDFDQWWVEDISFFPDGRHLATIDQNAQIRVFSLESSRLALTSMAPAMNKSVSCSPDGGQLASGGLGAVQVWAISN